MPSVSVEPLDNKSCVEPALALGPLPGDLNRENWLLPFLLIRDLRK